MKTTGLSGEALHPKNIIFVPDYPHSVVRMLFPNTGNSCADIPEIIDSRLHRFCKENGICISMLPQTPELVLRIEGRLLLADRRRDRMRSGIFAIGNRKIPFESRTESDFQILKEASSAVLQNSDARNIKMVIGGFPENREPSIIVGFKIPTGIILNKPFRTKRPKKSVENFTEPHIDPDDPEEVSSYLVI
ncbi:MAG: hypothetical protein WCJ25_04255 [Candidatus Moraniibacteriota bacterium]